MHTYSSWSGVGTLAPALVQHSCVEVWSPRHDFGSVLFSTSSVEAPGILRTRLRRLHHAHHLHGPMLLIVVRTISSLAGMETGRERTVRSGNARPPPPARQHSLPRLNALCTGRSVLWYKWRLPRGLAVGFFLNPRRARLQFPKNSSLWHLLPRSAPRASRRSQGVPLLVYLLCL